MRRLSSLLPLALSLLACEQGFTPGKPIDGAPPSGRAPVTGETPEPEQRASAEPADEDPPAKGTDRRDPPAEPPDRPDEAPDREAAPEEDAGGATEDDVPGEVDVELADEGLVVPPQTVVHLRGSALGLSDDATYRWSVVQPPGSKFDFEPSPFVPDPTFEANVAGSYTFTVEACDGGACGTWSVSLEAVPDSVLHVELLWHTPLDADETDEGPEAGTDLDLHLLHPNATGEDVDGDGVTDGWFNQPWDCFWFNADPNWSSVDPAANDDPSLDRDDTDGAGPENINLNVLEDVCYRIGAHTWNDHGWGPSVVTVRIYLFGALSYEKSLTLTNHGLWEVAEVCFPDATVEPISEPGGNPKIIPNYQHPFFWSN